MAATDRFKRMALRSSLGTACAALGLTVSPVQATEVDTAVLFYSETDRVSALELVAAANHTFGGERSGNIKLVFDSLTGASGNGAVPWNTVQTFTRPSGNGSYTTPADTTPLDDTFQDGRITLGAGLSQPLGEMTTVKYGVYGSSEYDYTSLGGNLALSRDLDRRNTTLSAAMSYSHDTISPHGGRPEPFAEMLPPGAGLNRLIGDGSKSVADLILSLSQVISRTTVAQVNYSLSMVSGYQTDPFKVVSVVDPTSGEPLRQLYEHRPDSRTKHILFTKLKHHLSRDVIDLSYRFMSDDWGVVSHTLDCRYRLEIGESKYLQPHARWYRQSAADHYTRYLVDGDPLPGFMTADYRLGELTTWTLGLKHGRSLGERLSLNIRGEYYRQVGSGSANAPGELANQDLYPTVQAMFVQVGVGIKF